MKTLFTTFCMLLVLTAGFGQRYSISKVETTPASPARLQPGTKVDVSFSYTKPTGDVRIFVRPMYRGGLADNYAASGGVLYTANSGAGTADFTITSPGRVDQLRFQFVDPKSLDVVFEDFVDASFRFTDYEIFDVVFTPPSTAALAINQRVDLTYSYFKPAGNVRIYLMPMYMGGQAEGYGVPGSILFTDLTGTTTGFFLLNRPGHVDQLRFQVLDPATSAILYETFIAVDYHWVAYEISNIVLNPPSPARLKTGTSVSVNFNYSKPDGDVRIFVRPMFGGNLASNYMASGASLYSANSGSGNSDFTLASAGSVDQIRFQFTNSAGTEVLAEVFYSVDLTWVNYQISNVTFDPPSPANLAVNQHVNVNFSYAKINGDVTIFTEPMAGGAEALGYAHQPSPLYSANNGVASSYFLLTQSGIVDQVRFRIMDATASIVLFEEFYNVDYQWIGYEIKNVVFDRVSPSAVPVRQEIFTTFNYTKPDGDIRIFVRGRYQGADAGEFYYEGSPLYTENSGSGGSHFFLSIPGKVDQIRFWIADADGNGMLYETFIPVDFSWVEYEVSDVVFTPASPATLQTGNLVNVNFNYNKPDGEVRIFVRPYYGDSPSANYSASPSELYATNTGSGFGDFTLNSPGLVDYVRISIWDNLPDPTILFERFYPVEFQFVSGSGIETNQIGDGFSLYPIPCNRQLTICAFADRSFSYGIYTLQGSLLASGQTDSGQVTLDTAILTEGTYLVRLKDRRGTANRILVKQ